MSFYQKRVDRTACFSGISGVGPLRPEGGVPVEATAKKTESFRPEFDFFVGVDSDGCVFDTMELKQKKCFSPVTTAFFGLEDVGEYVRETSEFVGLYSRWRGLNRFPALLKTFDLLRDRPEVARSGASLPDLEPLRRWVDRQGQLSNPALEEEAGRGGDPVLKKVLEWSRTVNRTIAERVPMGEAFPDAVRFLRAAREKADLIVVSQTPMTALEREWRDSGLSGHVRLICGQELGSKSRHLKLTAGNRYPPEHTLMVGDALGDLAAARETGFLFFPILPGDETYSWKALLEEGMERFFQGGFAGTYQDALVEKFRAVLPETPPWRVGR